MTIRLGYRLQNNSIQRNTYAKSFAESVTLDIGLQAAERNINDTKDILLWNADKFRVFEIANTMIPMVSNKSQLLFTRSLTPQLTQLYVWVQEFKQRVVIQSRPLCYPATTQEAKKLIDYIHSLAYIVTVLGNDSSVLLNLEFYDEDLAKFIRGLDQSIKDKLLINISNIVFAEHMHEVARVCKLDIAVNISNVIKYYADRVVSKDPVDFWVEKSSLLYMNGSDYSEYSRVRKSIYLNTRNNDCDIIMPSHIDCQEILRETYLKKPFWKYTHDKVCY